MRFASALAVASTLASPALAGTAFLTSGTTVALQGQVSDYRGQAGLIEERFATNKAGACVQTRPGLVAFSSLGSPMGPLPTNGALVRGVFPGRALPPGTNSASLRDGVPIADQSCYLAAPSPTSGVLSGQISADINLASPAPVLYFGFYWGSIDPTNTLTLLSRPNASGVRTPITVSGLSDATGAITGAELLAIFNHPVGFNSFVSFRFSAAENFGTVIFGAPTPGFEVDNIAYSTKDFLATPPAQNQQAAVSASPAFRARSFGVQPLLVPEPALAGVLGLALAPLLLRAGRRRIA